MQNNQGMLSAIANVLLEGVPDLWQTFRAGCLPALQQHLTVLRLRLACTYRYR